LRGSCSRSGWRRSPSCRQLWALQVGPTGRCSIRPTTAGRQKRKKSQVRASAASGRAQRRRRERRCGDQAHQTAAEQEQAFRQRKTEADEKARKGEKLAQEQQQQAEACANARRDLAGVQSGARVARLNEAGERIFLDDSGVQSEISRLQRDVAANCK
jgi:hypothetical protein